MKRLVLLAVVLVATGSAQSRGDHATMTDRSSDAAMAQLLSSLTRPASAQIQANDIKIPNGEVTRCESYTLGNQTESDCSPQTRFEEIHQLVLLFSINGESIKVVAGCSSVSDGRRCHSFGYVVGANPPACHGGNPYICSTKGIGTFLIEGRKKKQRYFVYPVEGGKPNHRYDIPVVTVKGERPVDFDNGSWEPIDEEK